VTDPFVHYDAAYVLGALSDSERRAFEAHLATCLECTARVAEIAPLPQLLAGLPEDSFRPVAEPVPDTILPRLLREVRHEQRRRRGVIATLGGLVAASVLALALVLAWPAPHTKPPQALTMSAVAESPVHATAALTDVSWGTRIRLVCTYDSGYPPGVAYALVVVDKQGVAHDAGSWSLQPGKTITFVGGTAVPRSDIGSVEISRADSTDHPILQLTL
jgi:hypothetical protein